MLSKRFIITHPDGLHLRPATVLCGHSIEFRSNIILKAGSKSVNAKSVLGVLSALIKCGDEVELICDGPDEAEAMELLDRLFSEGFEDDRNNNEDGVIEKQV